MERKTSRVNRLGERGLKRNRNHLFPSACTRQGRVGEEMGERTRASLQNHVCCHPLPAVLVLEMLYLEYIFFSSSSPPQPTISKSKGSAVRAK